VCCLILTFSNGSAFIIRSAENPELYFVLTAAHCVNPGVDTYIQVKYPQHHDKTIKIGITPIIVDPSNDVAVLLIPASEVKAFKEATGSELPAIPGQQLSSIKPRKDEVLALQGYPDLVPFKNFYREKFMYGGAETANISKFTGGKQTPTAVIRLNPIESYNPVQLFGASGGPIIAIRDKKPYIQGISSAAGAREKNSWVRSGPVYAAGSGELPSYLQKAEEKVQKAQIEKSWWRSWLHW
jgi:hypothetical protein